MGVYRDGIATERVGIKQLQDGELTNRFFQYGESLPGVTVPVLGMGNCLSVVCDDGGAFVDLPASKLVFDTDCPEFLKRNSGRFRVTFQFFCQVRKMLCRGSQQGLAAC